MYIVVFSTLGMLLSILSNSLEKSLGEADGTVPLMYISIGDLRYPQVIRNTSTKANITATLP